VGVSGYGGGGAMANEAGACIFSVACSSSLTFIVVIIHVIG